MSTEKLKVGDVLYKYGSYSNFLVKRIVVDRLTTTQAICGETRLRNQICNYKTVTEIGGGYWYISTPDLDKKWKWCSLYHKARNMRADLALLDEAQLQQYINLFTPSNPNTNE